MRTSFGSGYAKAGIIDLKPFYHVAVSPRYSPAIPPKAEDRGTVNAFYTKVIVPRKVTGRMGLGNFFGPMRSRGRKAA